MVDQKFTVSVHIMTVMAYHAGELMTSDELADSVRTNPTVVRRLIARLVDAGLIESFKGKSGGVRLKKTPKEIDLREIYRAVSENKKLLHAPDKAPLKKCAVSCAMKGLLDGVLEGFEDNSMKYLSKIKLADLAAKV